VGRPAGAQFAAPGVTRLQVINDILAAIKAANMPAPYCFANAKAIDRARWV
jgi:hypothetical protein